MKATGSIIDRIYEAHRLLAALEEAPREYIPGESLFASEIHMVEAVWAHEGCNLTELAQVQDISPPAAFKVAAKLERKGYLVKRSKEENAKEVIFWLTAKGRQAAARHADFEKRTFGPLRALEASLSPGDRVTIAAFLDALKEALE